jgi:hypothetical protein
MQSREAILKEAYFDKAAMAIVLVVDLGDREATCPLHEDAWKFPDGADRAEELAKTAALFDARRGMRITLSHEQVNK